MSIDSTAQQLMSNTTLLTLKTLEGRWVRSSTFRTWSLDRLDIHEVVRFQI